MATLNRPTCKYVKGFLGGSDGKEFSCNAGDPGLIPGLGKCKYVTLYGKRDFTDMIKVSKSEIGRFSSVQFSRSVMSNSL